MRRGLLAGVGSWVFVVVAGLAPGAPADEPPGSWLGVRLGQTTADGSGVIVSRVFAEGPAERAGVRSSDVILSFAGQPVRDTRDLVRRVQALDPGAWVPLTLRRQGQELEIDVRLGDRPAKVDLGQLRSGWIGVESIDLPEALREHFGAPPDAGVMISEVVPGGPAEGAGFRLGDVVYAVDDEPVGSARALEERVRGAGVGNDHVFLVARDGALLELEARVAPAP